MLSAYQQLACGYKAGILASCTWPGNSFKVQGLTMVQCWDVDAAKGQACTISIYSSAPKLHASIFWHPSPALGGWPSSASWTVRVQSDTGFLQQEEDHQRPHDPVF